MEQGKNSKTGKDWMSRIFQEHPKADVQALRAFYKAYWGGRKEEADKILIKYGGTVPMWGNVINTDFEGAKALHSEILAMQEQAKRRVLANIINSLLAYSKDKRAIINANK